jgi:hypothetical protein
VDLDQLRHDGFTVAEQVVGPELRAATIAAMGEIDGFVLEDPATWGAAGRMLPIWGHQALWDVRQHPPVHAAFAAAYGTETLWVTMDRASIKLPGDGALAIHWDFDPATTEATYLQGVVALTDAPAGAGGFCCVPELYRDRAGWVARHAGEQTWGIDLEGHAPTPVPARAGDLILFDARLPHGNEANGAATPRLAQYVSMFDPARWGGSAEDRVGLHAAGRSTFAIYDGISEPWPPARLSPLGRRLLGAEPWPGAAPRP